MKLEHFRNKHWVITRPKRDTRELRNFLLQHGAQVTCLPVIEIQFHLSSELNQQLKNLSEFSGLVFTSKNGVRAFVRNSGQPRHVKIPVAVVGEATEVLWRKLSGSPAIFPLHSRGSEDLTKIIVQAWTKLDKAKPILFIKASRGGEIFISALERQGFGVRALTGYSTHAMEASQIDLALIAERQIDGIVFFSPSAVKAWHAVSTEPAMRQLTRSAICLSIGPKTTQQLEILGFSKIEEMPYSNLKSLML